MKGILLVDLLRRFDHLEGTWRHRTWYVNSNSQIEKLETWHILENHNLWYTSCKHVFFLAATYIMNAKALEEQTGIKPSDLWCRRGGRKKLRQTRRAKRQETMEKTQQKVVHVFFLPPGTLVNYLFIGKSTISMGHFLFLHVCTYIRIDMYMCIYT